MINEMVRMWLPGGVQPDAQERGVRDYRRDACLTVSEMRKVIIRCICACNHRTMETYPQDAADLQVSGVVPMPVDIWQWGIGHRGGALRSCSQERLKYYLLTQGKARITAQGIRFRGLYYTCQSAVREGWFATARQKSTWEVQVSYDPNRLDQIYIYLEETKGPERCDRILRDDEKYQGYSLMEYMAANDKLKGIIAKGKAESERYQAAAQQEIRKIAECATRRMASEPERRAPVKNVRRNRQEAQRAEQEQIIMGLTLVLILCFIAIFADQLAPHDPNEYHPDARLQKPEWFSRGIDGYIFGTDSTGRDILSRMIIGAKSSMQVALFSTFLSLIIGTVLGIIAGFKGGILDAIIMRSTEVTMAVPTMTLGVVIMAIFGTSIINLLIVMVISYWMNFARVARNEVIAIRGREFVQASRALGATNSHIMFTQILPNVTTSLIICTSNCFGSVILTESTLSYLYLGVQLPTASWGNMIAAGKDFMAVAPWTVIVPGVALMMAVMGFNFLGDGLRDVLDPKQTR